MPDKSAFGDTLATQQRSAFGDTLNQSFVPRIGTEANQPLQMSGPGEFLPPQAPLTPSEEIEQFILSARMRQGRPREARTPSQIEAARRVRLIANAGLFNFAPEIGSRFAAIIHDLSEDEARQLEALMEREIAQFRAERPGATLTAEIAGGGVGGPGAVATRMMGAARTLPAIVGRGAAAGGVVGAAAGAGEAPPGERLQGATTGAVMGAGLGAAAPLILSAGARGLRAAVNRIRGGTTQRNAANRVLQALDAEEITLDEARQRLNRLGVEATLADVSDETRRLLRGTTSEPGRISAQATRLLNERQDRQGMRILDTLERQMPSSASFQGTVDDLVSMRRNAARPLYQRAYAREIEFTPQMRELFNRPAIRRAWKGAQEIAANEGIELPQVFVEDAAGNLTLSNAPNMPTIDFIKRSLDDIVEGARDQLTGKIVGDRAQAVAAVRRELIDMIDELNPAYAAARQAFAGPSGSLDALHLGRRFARGDPEILAKQLEKLTPNDQAFFRMGVVQGLRDIVLRTPDGVNAARRVAGNELARQRLREVFPDDESFETFMGQIDREIEFARTRQTALGGSPTARIQAEQSQLAGPAADLALDMATGQPGIGTIRRLLGAGGARRTDPEVVRAVGQMLLSQGDDLQSVLNRLQATQAGSQAAAQQRAILDALLTGGTAAQGSRLR